MRRLLLEIFIIGALVALAWERPLNRFAPGAEPVEREAPEESPSALRSDAGNDVRPVRPQQRPPSGEWMFDEKRRSSLDPSPSEK